MAAQLTQLMFTIGAGEPTDDEELEQLSQRLREDLIEMGAESVDRTYGGEAPADSKGGLVALATLAVTLAPTALTGLISMLQSWLTRHERTTLTLQSGKRKMTVSGTLSKEQRQVIADWLHADRP